MEYKCYPSEKQHLFSSQNRKILTRFSKFYQILVKILKNWSFFAEKTIEYLSVERYPKFSGYVNIRMCTIVFLAPQTLYGPSDYEIIIFSIQIVKKFSEIFSISSILKEIRRCFEKLTILSILSKELRIDIWWMLNLSARIWILMVFSIPLRKANFLQKSNVWVTRHVSKSCQKKMHTAVKTATMVWGG